MEFPHISSSNINGSNLQNQANDMHSATNVPNTINNADHNNSININKPRKNSCMSDFDYQECDLFAKPPSQNGLLNNPNASNNHNTTQQQTNHESFLQQNAYFYEAPGNSNVFLPPRKYEYLGQKEEQIYQDSKSAMMMNIPDFDFHPFYGHLPQRNYTQSAQMHASHHNHPNNLSNNIPHSSSSNNLLSSALRKNSEVDISDLFPPAEPVPKMEHQQFYDESDFAGNNDNVQPRESSSHFSHSSPIIPKNEPNAMDDQIFYQLQHTTNQAYPISLHSTQRPYYLEQQQQQQLPQQQYQIPFYYSHQQMLQQQQQLQQHQQFQQLQLQQQQLLQPFHMNSIHQGINNNQTIPSYFNIQPKRVNVFSIVRDQQNDRKKDYDKNICRYITRQVVRSFASPDFKNKVLTIIADIYPEAPSNNILSVYKDVTEYFLGEIENLSGFRALKEVLLINVEIDGKGLATQKRIFRSFMKWFLKERYFRNILNGNMNDKLAFIKYKNKIMLHYINKPHKWNSNKKKAQQEGKDISMQSKLEC